MVTAELVERIAPFPSLPITTHRAILWIAGPTDTHPNLVQEVKRMSGYYLTLSELIRYSGLGAHMEHKAVYRSGSKRDNTALKALFDGSNPEKLSDLTLLENLEKPDIADRAACLLMRDADARVQIYMGKSELIIAAATPYFGGNDKRPALHTLDPFQAILFGINSNNEVVIAEKITPLKAPLPV